MSSIIYQNEKFLDENRAHISVADRGYLVGEGLFETLRAYNNHVIFVKEHLLRLQEGAEKLGIVLPVSLERLRFLVYQTLHLNKLQDAVVRIYLSPEGSGIGDLDSPAQKTNLLISCKPLTLLSPKLYQQGVSLAWVKGVAAEQGLLSQIKSTSYLSRVLARREVQAKGYFEGILLNSKGCVTEGSGSNLFIVVNSEIFTPPGVEGLLSGVTRQQVMHLAEKEGFEVIEKALLPEDLLKADEVFITSTLKEVMPVAQIEKDKIKSCPGPITQKLLELYRDTVQWQVENAEQI